MEPAAAGGGGSVIGRVAWWRADERRASPPDGGSVRGGPERGRGRCANSRRPGGRPPMRLRPLLAAAALIALATGLARPPAAGAAPPPIGHVFVIVLENEDAATAFGPS